MMAEGALFDDAELRRETGQAWREFFRVPDMSTGIYTLEVGATDGQSPHGQDELYYVLDGRATLAVGDEELPAEPGALLYVAKGAEHRFHTITERLRLLVIFAPAEAS